MLIRTNPPLPPVGRDPLNDNDVFSRPAVHFKQKIGTHLLFFGFTIRLPLPGRMSRISGMRESSIDPAIPVGESLTH